ncbi:MAG: ATP-dependent RecD-like DNA helicase [Firmicutes bacterium]|nr:ATP-dependent RecD-like DNA helicase [Bacillota bacterium]
MNYIEGLIKQYLFYSDDSSYSVIKVEIIDTNELDLLHFEPTVIVCGFFPRLDALHRYRFFGEVTNHPKYGVQYNANRFERLMEKTREGIIDYLSSDLFKGIGPKTAENIVDFLGEDTLDQIANNPDVLNNVPLMNEKKKNIIETNIIKNRQVESTLVWLYGFQISPKMAMKIYSHYGFSAIDIIKTNPYILMDDIEGIGFKRADEIGLKIGFSFDNPLRIKAVISYLLIEYMNKYGDTFLLKERLVAYTLSYLNVSEDFYIEESQIFDMLDVLASENKIIYQEDKISLTHLFYAEKGISNYVFQLNEIKEESFDLDLIETYISDFEKLSFIEYTPIQRLAIKTALEKHFVIITGGPGTGKTTIINGIVHVYKLMHQNDLSIRSKIKLAAPTGKAAKRLKEATNMEVTTIHRLLGLDYEGHFTFNEHNKIEASLVVIDEASMLDVLLAKQLFRSIQLRTKVIIVGDDNQLPSVGPGQVLTDLLESDLFPVVKLNKIHRQAYDSSIISLAYDILNQNLSENLIQNNEDRKFIRSNDSLVSSVVLKVIQEAINEGFDLQEDIQVLVPMYKGINGIDHLNQLIQERFNKQHLSHKITNGDKTFCFNDKVLQLVNQPEDSIMNGDLGVVVGIIEDKEMLVDFSGNQVKYNVKDFDNLALAYAISIHKSQGSEFKIVILPLVRSYTIMLKRKLLYTAVTRAKEKLIMIGDYSALRQGVSGQEVPRNTLLKSFLSQVESNHLSENLLTIEDFL